MKTFKVGLDRIYVVTVTAENEESAHELAEFFIGDCHDESTPNERDKYNFSISEVEMVHNDAFEAKEIVEEENLL